ncbi:MAG: hypothetical protein ACETWM_00425 [Candidatus Lokiarchaeia archaeon]
MAKIEFRTIIRNRVEYRFDPLTGEQSRINPERAKRIKQAEIDVEFSDIINKSSRTCPFCPESINEKTPKFPKELCEEGRIKVGESVIFPNLNPFGENHAVGTITHAHYLDLDEFQERMLRDNLTASIKYILKVSQRDKEVRYPIYVWNFMPPSAGSIIHPHVQLLVEREPTPQQERLLKKSQEYFKENGANYWKDLIQEEKKKDERYIGENDSLSVIATFAPRGYNEVQFIFDEASSLTELGQKEIKDFASSLSKVLQGYKKIGIGSFNLASFSASIKETLDYYCLNIKLISRPFPRGVYTSDTGPMERLYDVWVINTLPETVAEEMKRFFSKP